MPPLSDLVARRPELLMLDCDGVIYDTNRLKCDAYRYALDDAPGDRVEELVRWHQQTGGVSRFVKLRRFFEEIHPVADVEGALARALDRFSAYASAGYSRLVPRPEALELTARFGDPARVYVVSGGAQAELADVFAAAGVRSRFAAILGSPAPKRSHIAALLSAHGVAPRAALFVGDGWGDWDATQATGVPLVHLAEMSEWRGGVDIVAATPDAAVAHTWAELLDAARW